METTLLDAPQCLSIGESLAERLGDYALCNGASYVEARRAAALCAAALPLALWQRARQAIANDARSLAESLRMSNGQVCRWALAGEGLPMELRQPLLFQLHPESNALSVVWWDQVAWPMWVEPFMHSLREDDSFAEAVAARAAARAAAATLPDWVELVD